MVTFLKDLIPCFFCQHVGNEGRQKNLAEFIKNLNFAIEGQTYTDENRKLTATWVIFQTNLQEKVPLWYHGLNVKT